MGTRFTIYGQLWNAAHRRMPSLPEPLRTRAAEVAEMIERGWAHVAPLAGVVEPRLALLDPDGTDPDAVVHHFVDGEVADLFHGLATGWTAAVLDWRDYAVDDLPGDLALFRRYLLVAELASRAPGISPDVRAAFEKHTPALARWCDEAAPVFASFVDAFP